MLTDHEFWEIVSSAGVDPAIEDDEPYQRLEDLLAKGPEERITGFADILARKLYDLDRRYLFDAAELSDDGFLYARCAVVMAGSDVYDEVLREPAAFLPYTTPEAEHAESVLDVPSRAFERLTGRVWDHFEDYDYETGSNEQWWPQ